MFCSSPQHHANEAGHSTGSVSWSFQPHGQVQGTFHKTAVTEERGEKQLGSMTEIEGGMYLSHSHQLLIIQTIVAMIEFSFEIYEFLLFISGSISIYKFITQFMFNINVLNC